MCGSNRFYLAAAAALAVLAGSVALAQAPEAPLDDTRLTVHTLLREDVFAGFIGGDMERLARGEKNIDLLMEKRPADRAALVAWKASTILYRAIVAHEAKQRDKFDKHYAQALDLYAQARKLIKPQNYELLAIEGGSYAMFADRLPKEHQAAAWTQAYESFQGLWKVQAPIVDKLPLHLKGELWSGLAASAQRTGRAEEARQHLDKMLELLKDTPYEAPAKEWKANPTSTRRLTCLSCHDAGRLSDRLSALEKK